MLYSEVVTAILILLISFYYFLNKEKYIELPEISENFHNVHVFNYDDIVEKKLK